MKGQVPSCYNPIMGRAPRAPVGNMVYHILNRANGRMQIFRKDKDYEAFEKILIEAKQKQSMRVLAYCLMPNHWDLVLHTYKGGVKVPDTFTPFTLSN